MTLSPIAFDLLRYYCDLTPLYDQELFATRQSFVAAMSVDEETIRAAIGVLSVRRVWFEKKLFDLEPINGVDAEIAVVGEVKGADGGTTLDLFAWRVDRTGEVATLSGRPRILGVEQFERHNDMPFDKPLMIHRSISDWLRAWCIGIAITDVRRAAHLLLSSEGRFQAADDEHGLELQAALRSHIDFDKIVVAAEEGCCGDV